MQHIGVTAKKDGIFCFRIGKHSLINGLTLDEYGHIDMVAIQWKNFRQLMYEKV